VLHFCVNQKVKKVKVRFTCKVPLVCASYGLQLIYQPWRDGKLNWPSWLTHKVVTCQP